MIFRKDRNIYSPVSGEYVPLSDVKDTTFSTGLMGPGVAFDATEQTIVSPFSGQVSMFFPTKHALGLKRKDGLEVLIHVGIETVNLGGEGFTQLVQRNDQVKKGEALLKFDRQYVLDQGLDPTVIMILTNSSEYDLAFNGLTGIIDHGDVIGNAKRK